MGSCVRCGGFEVWESISFTDLTACRCVNCGAVSSYQGCDPETAAHHRATSRLAVMRAARPLRAG